LAPSWIGSGSSDFWAYPVEHNAFQRSPKFNDVFALSQQVWTVGGGETWQLGRVQ